MSETNKGRFVPKLRFKDDGGKEYPDWKIHNLGTIAECLNKKRIPLNGKERNRRKGSIPYWGANGIFDYVNDYIFDETVILLAEDGGHFDEYSTKPIASISYGKCWVNNHAHVLRGRKEICINEYLYYSLVHRDILGYVSGSTRAKLTKSNMLNILLPVPSLKEQQKIADFLSSFDELISIQSRKVDLLKTYKKGLMQQLFPREGETTPRLRFPEFQDAGEWEESRLETLFDVNVGGDIDDVHSRKTKDEVFCYPVYANSEKLKGLHSYSDQFRIDQDCITVSGRGTLGVAHARFERFFPIVRLLVLVPKIKSNLIFFEHAINELQIYSESTGVPQLTAPQLKRYHIRFPSFEEQQKIADCLSSFDELISIQFQKEELLKIYKKGLMQQLFPN